ncbi:hypothetical protein Tco_0700258 [Tanacetum coccineum]
MKKAFLDMLMNWGEVNPVHAYYNGSCTSKDNGDPSWSTSFKNRRTSKTSSALEALWKTFFMFLFVHDRNILVSELKFLSKMFLRRSEGEELEYPFFEGDGSSSDEWRDYGMAGDDYEGPPIFDDDQYEEDLMPVYDTDIEDVIEEEE